MPLVRVKVSNECALGAPERHGESNGEDSKEILQGVAVAGLIGILRQLGDLAEFAAEVFHGLQDEVVITSSRSHKLMGRVKRIESALSPLEKAILAQRSHLHFTYTAGCDWNAHIHCAQNHFVNSDVPQFIMDSYEDSCGPPRLHSLDRFDPGGPGSCLKRYSDPSFFKRASVASGEASTEYISKYKKGCKSKERRPWARNQEVSRGASFSYHSGRMQFAQLNVGGHASPSQTMPTYDTMLRSELGEQSNLDFSNGSAYIQGDFHPSYSMQSKEQEPSESTSSPVKRCDNDFLNYNFLEEDVTEACDDIQINLAQKRGGCSSSSVTCDENNGTLDPEVNGYDRDDHDTVKFETIGKMDVRTCNQDLPAMRCGDICLDDIESETDNFMDALNTIDSESEAGLCCRTKKEVEHYPELDERAKNGVYEPMEHNSECQSSSSHSNMFANSCSTNGRSEQNPILVSPEASSEAHYSNSGEAAEERFNSVTPVDKSLLSAQRDDHQSIDSLQNGKINDATNFRDDRSGMPIIDETRSSHESQKPAAETSNVNSFTFWTNGSLLGLQPSKPPECSVLNAPPQDPLVKKNEEISSSSVHRIDSDFQAMRNHQESSGGSSRMSDLSNILLNTESSKNILPASDENANVLMQKNHQKNIYRTFAGRNKDLFASASLLSPPSSPPLEHMKISFQPIDGFETSKLKLKFPDSSRDTFPSFQLVPEVCITQHDVCSDSEDDTIYRSSPSLSDDYHSHEFESNSEKWESEESSISQNHDLYDSLRNYTSSQLEPSPATPPLPPVQWRGMKPNHDYVEDKYKVMPEGSDYAFDIKHSTSTISQQPKPAPFNHDQILETINVQKSKEFVSQKSNGQNEADQGKSINENDFLHQIRAKSFSLRPTVKARPIMPAGPTVNVQVTAILEKANAIRQAVASDGEDDGNWSDT